MCSLARRQNIRLLSLVISRLNTTNSNASNCVLFSDYSGNSDLTNKCGSDSLIAPGCQEDVSDIAPYHVASFNLAAYVNKSPTLQQLVKLGVNLHRIERTKGVPSVFLKLDFERDMKKHIKFLHDVGIPSESLGDFITRNPLIFTQDMDNLEIRINYLCSKKFTAEAISRILMKNPSWLMYSTQDIDEKLGYFQNDFKLTGQEVRFVATKQPKLITYDLNHIKNTTFAVREEMGFTVPESKEIVLRKPKIYTLNRHSLTSRFDYIHNSMGIPHTLILEQLQGLLSREQRLKDRHEFLASLNKAIYDPKQMGYISLTSLVSGNDSDFCRNVAQVPVSYFNKFLKTR